MCHLFSSFVDKMVSLRLLAPFSNYISGRTQIFNFLWKPFTSETASSLLGFHRCLATVCAMQHMLFEFCVAFNVRITNFTMMSRWLLQCFKSCYSTTLLICYLIIRHPRLSPVPIFILYKQPINHQPPFIAIRQATDRYRSSNSPFNRQ